MRSRRYTLGSYVLAVTLLVPVVSPGITPGASAESSVRTILQGFESQGSDVSVSTDNLRFRDGRPFVGLKRVRYVPGQAGNAMRVDFSIIGGHWQNVMVKLNEGVPWNLTGQTQLDVTMKGDWNDTGGAQSVTLMMKMTNGSFWGVSFAVTDQWKTYSFPLDPAGDGLVQQRTRLGVEGPVHARPDRLHHVLREPARDRHVLPVVRRSLRAAEGRCSPTSNPDAPTPFEFSSIPYAIGQAVDDIGWREYDNRYQSLQNYQQLIHRDKPTLADYQTVVDIGQAAGTRLMTAWILQDLDRNNVLASPRYNTPVARYDMTEEGLAHRNHITRQAAQDHGHRQAERGVHGVRPARRLP